MKILGIDQSFKCTGLVVLDGDYLDTANCYKTSLEDGDNFYRAHMISNYIWKYAKENEIDAIVIEGIAMAARGDVTRELGGLLYAIVIKLNVVAKYQMEIVPPTTLKKYATGHGHATKETMMSTLSEDVMEYFLSLGYKKTTGLQDLTDAYWLANMYGRDK